jgi:hypothetical protein
MVEQIKERTHKRGARRTGAALSGTPYQKIAGVLLSKAGAAILMGIITAEALYLA